MLNMLTKFKDKKILLPAILDLRAHGLPIG